MKSELGTPKKKQFNELYERLLQKALPDGRPPEDVYGRLIERLAYLSIVGTDASFVRTLAIEVRDTILSDQPMPPILQLWLVGAMDGLAGSEKAAREIVKEAGRGAPKNGYKALIIAGNVLNQILYGKALKIDDAQTAIAEHHHVEAETVRKYWSQYKYAAMEIEASALGLGINFGDETAEEKCKMLDEALSRYLAEKKKGIEKSNSVPGMKRRKSGV